MMYAGAESPADHHDSVVIFGRDADRIAQCGSDVFNML